MPEMISKTDWAVRLEADMLEAFNDSPLMRDVSRTKMISHYLLWCAIKQCRVNARRKLLQGLIDELEEQEKHGSWMNDSPSFDIYDLKKRLEREQ